MTCSSIGCGKPATCCPRICVPAMGTPLESDIGFCSRFFLGKKAPPPIKITMGLELCDEHFAKFDVQKMLTHDGRAMLRHKIAQAGKREPDFDRAYVVAVSLEHNDVKTMKASRIQRTLGMLAGVPPK